MRHKELLAMAYPSFQWLGRFNFFWTLLGGLAQERDITQIERPAIVDNYWRGGNRYCLLSLLEYPRL